MRRPSLIKLMTLALTCVVVIVLVNACRKEEKFTNTDAEIEEKFFLLPGNANPALVRLVNYMKAQNEASPFVQKFIHANGYPNWEHAQVSITQSVAHRDGEDPDTLVVIPTVIPYAVFVKSLLNVKLTGDVYYKLFDGNNYAAYGFNRSPTRTEPNADDIAFSFMRYEREIFNTDSFKIKDLRLFTYWPAGSERTQPYVLRYQLMDGGGDCSHCDLYVISNEPPQWLLICDGTSPGTCPEVPNQAGGTTIFIPSPGGGGSGGWTTGIPTSNGGGTSGPIDPSPNPPYNPDICARGWVRFVPGINCPDQGFPPPPPGYNPEQADTVHIDSTLNALHPCFRRIIDTLSMYGNLNQAAQVALSSIFGVYKYMHISLKLDSALMGTTTDAYTVAVSPASIPPDTMNFSATIFFNPTTLMYGTNEYIAATVTHEAMHAYINYIFQQYQQGYIDSNQVKAMFPIFWRNVGFISSPTQQHNLMANNWVQAISNSLLAFSNPPGMTIPFRDSIYNALGWGGLAATDIFALQPNRCDIAAINFVAGRSNVNYPFTINSIPGLPLCPNTYTITAAGLKLRGICD